MALRPAKTKTQAKAETDRCPRCDATFGCGVATGSCWCAAATLSPERLAQLAAGYEGCLCPACLRELEHAG